MAAHPSSPPRRGNDDQSERDADRQTPRDHPDHLAPPLTCRNIRSCIKLRLRMKRKRKTQTERREETREELLAAAARVFAKRGFHATSLDAIAEEAGFSRGAVYYNFADKEELFLELLDHRCAERAQDLRAVFADNPEDDVAATSRQAQLPARRALEAMTGDPEWR